MFRLFTIILLLASANLKAQSILEFLEQKAGALKVVKSIDDADAQVRVLRQNLSVRPLDRDATSDEIQIITKTIVETETASLLANGAYDFQFSKTAYQLPRDTLTDRERTHYGYMFCLARTTHLLALNPLFNHEDVTTMLGRDVLSRYMPTWMKEIFERNLKQVDWSSWVKPYLNTKDFALTQFRQQERIEDQKTRKIFKLTVTLKDLDEAAHSHKVKGLPFDRSTCLQPGEYTFDAFAIKPDGACMLYGCQGPYGYYKRNNFGEQIIDNLDSDPYLQELVKDSIVGDYNVLFNLEGHSLASQALSKTEVLKIKTEALIKKISSKYDSLSDLQPLKEEIKKELPLRTLKEVINGETNSFFKTKFGGEWVTYVDIIAYLNSLNIYEFGREDHTLKSFSFQTHVAYGRSRTTFLLSTKGHVSRLVLRDDSLGSLFEYIKAKEHEKRYGVSVSPGYTASWM